MTTLSVYTFEREDGDPDTYTTMDYSEAEGRARRYGLRVVALEYEYSDSEVVLDFTNKPVTGFEQDEDE